MPFSCSGFEGLIKNLMSELPGGLVTYNRPVRRVHWNNTENRVHTVSVECDDGERIAADHVILTVPLGRLLHTYCTIVHLTAGNRMIVNEMENLSRNCKYYI